MSSSRRRTRTRSICSEWWSRQASSRVPLPSASNDARDARGNMNTTNRLWHVVAAVGLALFAVLLTTFYVTNYKRHVQHGQSQVTVVLAAKDIPADTPGSELLSGTWLTTQSVPRRQVVPGAISSPDQLRNLIATEPIYAGEQVTTRRFGTPAERGVRAQIKGTQRVVGVSGDAFQLLAGTLRVGDHIDIVGGWETTASGG